MEGKIDARKLSRDVIEEKRRQAHRLRKRGLTRVEIGDIVGVHADTVGRWLKLDARNLKVNRGGRKAGDARLLSSQEEKRIRAKIIDKTPEQLKLQYALWTRKAVLKLIEQETGMQLAIRSVGEYLKRWGMTSQKPQKRAYEQSAPAVQRWLKQEYPRIQACAKKENAEIYWGDGTGLRNDCQHERGYALKAQIPVIRLNANHASLNMIFAINNQGKVRFRFFEGTMNAAILIDFFMRLVGYAKRKIYLILDNLPVHHCKLAEDWLSGHQHMIEVFYLPSYSPELNIDEYLNCDLKAGVHSGRPARDKSQLKSEAHK